MAAAAGRGDGELVQPPAGADLGGVGGPATTLTVAGDAVRLRDPRPDAEHAGMVLVAGYLGGRDVRFVPVLGLPGRYSSGPQVGLGLAL